MNTRVLLISMIFFSLVLPARSPAGPLLQIFVSIPPQQYVVQQIAGDRAQVHVLVKPGKSPATYSPTPDQIRQLTRCDLYFRIGVPFENGFLHKLSSITAHCRIIDTRQNIRLRQMKSHRGEGGKDPHVWMDPMLVKVQARTMARALQALDPDNQDFYKTNLDSLVRKLDQLHRSLKAALAPLKGEDLFVFHPVFGYFADAYGMNQVAVETMGKAPRGKALSALIKLARSKKVRVIFVQPQFDHRTAQTMAAAINGVVVSIDPLAFDYLSNMKTIARTIASALTR